MKKLLIASLTACLAIPAVQAQTSPVPSADIQIKTAMLAAPSDKQAGARVYGYDASGQFKVLREGTNDLVCLTDDPNVKGINIACYHASLDPFMARGREMKKEKKTFEEIFAAREAEVKSDKLKMPKGPTTLFVYSGKDEDYDAAKGEMKDGYLRYVVYIPYATPESTGLPLKPEGPAMPWIMNPGTHAAHIMINPPKE